MKLLWKLSREAIRYRKLYIVAILSTLMLTVVNLTAPKVLSAMTGIVSDGVDEATASVDVETEQQIQQAISGISGSRTIIAIAHRLSTIRNADKILVIENGRVAESGTHEELVEKGGIYARMSRIQE